jgi:hypothetical protein
MNQPLISWKKSALCTFVLSMLATQSHAEITTNGFATLAAGRASSETPTLDGYDEDISFENNSLMAVQFNSDLGDGLTATAQVISEGSESWDARLEWAYVGYVLNENVNFLFGRQRTPFFLYSDYLDVSYAYHWITPPEELYSITLDAVNGASVRIENEFGDYSSSFQFLYGTASEELETPDGSIATVDIDTQIAATWKLERDWLALRLSYSTLDLRFSGIAATEGLATSWREAGFDDVANRVNGNDGDEEGSFFGAAITIDYGDFFAVAEYTEGEIENALFPKTEDYYISFGYRLGSLTPHFTYGEAESSASTDFLDNLDGAPAQLVGITRGALERQAFETDYYILGLRWDFHSSAALKTEYKRQDLVPASGDSESHIRVAIVTIF